MLNAAVETALFREYDSHLAACRKVFLLKMRDYGNSWRALRLSSVADQIYIKAKRIRTIEEKGAQKIKEGASSEFTAIVNYAVIGLMQREHRPYTLPEKLSAALRISPEKTLQRYDAILAMARSLMESKNHDYGDAWRQMQVSSFTDLILMKLMRIRQIEKNGGKTIASEGVDANLYDVINYAIFALVTLAKHKEP